MNKSLITLTFALILTSPAHSQPTSDFPAGWKPATAADYSADDLSFMKNRIPNHVEADFNGDGLSDHAWILVNTSKYTYGLFIFLKEKNGTYKIMNPVIDKKETDKLYIGISLMVPGKYKTACGKGYWDCKPDETEILKLKRPGINFFKFESAESVYYWSSDEKEFTRIWLSD